MRRTRHGYGVIYGGILYVISTGTVTVAPTGIGGGGGALSISLLCHASIWAVFCVTPVLRTGYDVMVEGLTCPHGRVQYGCCVIVGTLSWPWMSVGRLRDTVPARCGLCVHGDGVPADVCGSWDDWFTGL